MGDSPWLIRELEDESFPSAIRLSPCLFENVSACEAVDVSMAGRRPMAVRLFRRGCHDHGGLVKNQQTANRSALPDHAFPRALRTQSMISGRLAGAGSPHWDNSVASSRVMPSLPDAKASATGPELIWVVAFCRSETP